MARTLTTEAKKRVMDDASLYAEICLILNVKPGSLSQLVYRNSSSLSDHDVVKKIASEMNKMPDEILEDVPETTTA